MKPFRTMMPLTLPAGGVALRFGRGEMPGHPITSTIELAVKLQELCGAEGYKIDGPRNQVVALRWDESGSEVEIDRFEIAQVNA